jgi:hypothetical protein
MYAITLHDILNGKRATSLYDVLHNQERRNRKNAKRRVQRQRQAVREIERTRTENAPADLDPVNGIAGYQGE